MTVQELIDELQKVKDKNKQLYSAELVKDDNYPINIDVIETKKYVEICIYED